MDIYIVSNDGTPELKYTNTISWSDAGNYPNGKMKTLTLTASDKLSDGTYTIYALSHTASDDSGYIIPSFTNENIATIEDYVLEYKSGNDTPEEIFAGSVELTVTDRTFTQEVVLNRQVAGAYFYVYNLPKIEGMTKDSELQLVASDRNDQLVLGNFANTDITGNGNNNGDNVNYVVNGKKSGNASTERVICKAKISDWFSNIEADEKGLVDKSQWISTNEASGRNGKEYVKGSIFSANFIIPFRSVDNQQTLKLILVEGGNELRTWNVNLQTDSDAPKSLSVYGEGGWPTIAETVNETKHYYSIVRNHLYCVGTKNSDGVNTTDLDDTTKDNDPEDLSKGENLTLKVNHNWEVIYKMELE